MVDAHRLIDEIMADLRLQTSRVFAGTAARPEPLLRTASQMESYLPQRYRDMRSLGRPKPGADYRYPSQTRLFVEQARFMEDWEDDCPYPGVFERYFPTYASMNDRQLRGYFTWRTQVRRGNIEQTSLSFAFVYLYELLNCVGGRTPAVCYDKMKAFWLAYRGHARELDRFAKAWMRDFAVYYDLPRAVLEGVVDASFEENLIALRKTEACVLDAIDAHAAGIKAFEAMAALSNYRIDRSKFAREHTDDVRWVAGRVFAELCLHCHRRRSVGFCDSLFGKGQATPHIMFASAVVWLEAPHPDCLYRINDAHSYSCRDGRWTAQRAYRRPGRNAHLGAILHTIDRRMREVWGADPLNQRRDVPKFVARIIESAVGARAEELRAHEARRVDIDFSQLEGIRARAADVRETLLTDEEREEDAGVDGGPSADAPGPRLLSEKEREFLAALLEGTPMPCIPVSEDLMADAVNEALFDLLGDSALEFGEDGLRVVEDYREDLEGLVAS